MEALTKKLLFAILLITNSAFAQQPFYKAIGDLDIYKDSSYTLVGVSFFDTYYTDASDLILTFADGTSFKVDTPAEYPTITAKGYFYSVGTKLTPEQWKKVKTIPIISYKFHIFEKKYYKGNEFKDLANKVVSQ